MIRSCGCLLLAFLLWTPLSPVFADPSDSLIVRITPQVVETDQSVSWEQPLSQVTLPGNSVVVNIDAAPLVMRVAVTPFVRGREFLLVVQGDVKQLKANGTRHSRTVQSVMVSPGQTIVFFPLGRVPADTGHQMMVKIQVEFQGE